MNLQSLKNYLSLITISLFLFTCQKQTQHIRQAIDLSGHWQFSIDSADVGIQQKWHLTDLADVIELPGTTDLRHKGFLNHDTTTSHLNRLYHYEGPAWYRKKITIPQEFSGTHIQLIMERTKSSKVWIDDHYVGESRLLQSSQYYDVSAYLSPGEHTITIRINNDFKLTPYGQVHIYILTNPEHPIFNSFPTDFHTNWQWFSIIKASRALTLNKTAHDYLPIVQVIDNLERNNKLGLIFEFAVGKGKLLVSMARLNDIPDKPEAYQLNESIINYMKSGDFEPDYGVDCGVLEELF